MRNRPWAGWGSWTAGLLIVAALAPANPEAPVQQPPGMSDAVREKAEAKVKAASEVLAMCREFLMAPPGQRGMPSTFEVAEQIQFWSRQLTEAKLELATDHDERVKILTEAVEQAQGFEGVVKDLAVNEASGLTKLSTAKALYYRADAEVRLIRERDKPPGSRP